MPFDEPIRVRRGRKLTTLQHGADYIMKLPEAVQMRTLNRDGRER
jgi:hypothetical protein